MNFSQQIRRLNQVIGAVLLGGLTFSTATGQELSAKYAETITPAELKSHLSIIAADSLEGRFTGSPGQKKASAYMVQNFRKYGLTPVATDKNGQKSYYQDYQLYRRSWGETYIKTKDKTFTLHKDMVSNGLVSFPNETELETVFAGYGIDSDKYSDYKNLDVKGKVVVVLEGEPTDAAGKSLITPTGEKSKWNTPQGWQAKSKEALNRGAKFIVVITNKSNSDFQQEVQRRASMLQRVSPLTLKPVEESLNNVAAFTVTKEAGAAILGTSVKSLNKAIAKSNAAKGTSDLGGKIAFKAERKSETVDTENVVAFLEGTDKKDEVLVISAHIDHIGITPDGQINNGADDDGSGTVALLEIAQAFAKAKAEGNGPRRSILFLNVTGEELGLFGSEYYSENPVLPLENTIANLNIDMIGRVDEAHANNHNYVYLIGSDKLSSELHTISENANKKSVNFDLDYTFNDPKDPNRFYYRSDHYNFAKKGIPVIFYFTGVHPDYHRPGDDVEKILFDKQSSIVKLIFHTAWELVNREERIKVDSNKP